MNSFRSISNGFLLLGCIFSLVFVGCSRNLQGGAFGPHIDSASDRAPASSSNLAKENPLPEMTAMELERLGDMAYAREEFAKAYLQYENGLKKEPENKRMLYKKAMVLVSANLNQKAVAEFETIIARYPEQALSHEGIGLAYFQMKDYDRAEDHLKTAIHLDAKLWKAKNCLGMIYDFRKNYEEAIEMYTSAIDSNSRQGVLYHNLAVSYYLSGKYWKAVDAFQQAIQLGYATSKTHNNQGLSLAKVGKYEKALDAFAKAGSRAQAYNNLGCLLLAEEKYEKAYICFQKAVELSPRFYEIASANMKMVDTIIRSDRKHSPNTSSFN